MVVQAGMKPHQYRWVILGVLWTTYIVVYLNRLGVGPLAPFLKEDLGLTSTQIGFVISAASFGYMMTMFPVGFVVDKFGARWPLVIGEFIAGTSMIILFFFPSYRSLLRLMFLTGVGCGFLLAPTTQGVIAWFPPRERATVMGLKQTAVNVGGIITAATLPAVAIVLGWRYGFLFLGIIAIAIGIAALILYKEPPVASSGYPDAPAGKIDVSLLEILKNREIWLVAAAGFCFTWVEIAVIAHLVLYLTEALLFGVVTAGALLALTQAAGAIARPGSGLLSDRVFGGRRKPVFMLMAGTASAMCFVVGLFGPHLSWTIYPVLCLLGMGGIGFGGIFLTLVSEFGGRGGAGKAAGLGSTVCLAGGTLGPPIFGTIVDQSGSYTWAWLSMGFLVSLCIVFMFFVRETKRKI